MQLRKSQIVLLPSQPSDNVDVISRTLIADLVTRCAYVAGRGGDIMAPWFINMRSLADWCLTDLRRAEVDCFDFRCLRSLGITSQHVCLDYLDQHSKGYGQDNREQKQSRTSSQFLFPLRNDRR